jgi:hypothetical protein
VSDDEASMRCRAGAIFGVGLSVGVVIGIAVGTVVAMRVGSNAMDAIRGLLDRVSGRNNQVNFELLLQ